MGGDASVDAAHEIEIWPTVELVPVGRPGTVGGAVSGPGGGSSPAAWSTTTWSKFAVKILELVVPICTRPTAVVPVFAAHAWTMRVPSRYRSQVVADPTVPQTSMLCHPVPSCTPELRVTAPGSERSASVPVEVSRTLRIPVPPAVRRRRRSSVVPDGAVATFTFALAHSCVIGVARLRKANAVAAVPVMFARALGAEGDPVAESTVTRVAVQLLRFAKSSMNAVAAEAGTTMSVPPTTALSAATEIARLTVPFHPLVM